MTILSEMVKQRLTDLNVKPPVYSGELPSPGLGEAENARRDQAYRKWLQDLSWHEFLALFVREQEAWEKGLAEEKRSPP